MNQEELNEVLAKHKLWLESEGAKGEQADLSHADLSYADLEDANLSRANLAGANLSEAILEGVDLSHAILEGVDLSHADLSYANLSRAELSHANLSCAILYRAILEGAILSYANLSYANLSHTDLEGALLPNFQICPEQGDFIAWKKCKTGVVKLLIPATAQRTSNLIGRKCRASAAVVLRAPRGACSAHDGTTQYITGQTIIPDSYDPDIRVECTHGIHFFITKKEAQEY
jgi:uncharacterized protein YjbI with pentapeptide repeats